MGAGSEVSGHPVEFFSASVGEWEDREREGAIVRGTQICRRSGM